MDDKPTLIDDGSPEFRELMQRVLDRHFAELAEEIHERIVAESRDMTDDEADILNFIGCRRARRARELGTTGGTWPEVVVPGRTIKGGES